MMDEPCFQSIEEEVVNEESIIYDSILDDDMIKEETVGTEVANEEEIEDDENVEGVNYGVSCDNSQLGYDNNVLHGAAGEVVDKELPRESIINDIHNSIHDESQVKNITPVGSTKEVAPNPPSLSDGSTGNIQKDTIYGINSNSLPINSTGELQLKDGAIPPQDAWSHFTGLKVKQYTETELNAFKKPFEMGWRREVVLRGTVTNSGKKIGDVYYFSPDKNVKLRSYVEMGLYLKKHQDCGLEPENFTFARQPIFKYPQEIVRHAMQRGSNQKDSKEVKENKDAAGNESKPTTGQTKRKRVAPSRFEDEDYSEQSPFKKKPKTDKSSETKNSQAKVTSSNGSVKSSLLAQPMKKNNTTESVPSPVQSKPPATTAATTTTETIVEEKQEDVTSSTNVPIIENKEPVTNIAPNSICKKSNLNNSHAPSKSKSKSAKQHKPKLDNDINHSNDVALQDNTSHDFVHPLPPCSIMCNGKKGLLPNLLCSRCLCLFHHECVPRGIFTEDPRKFICPNCIQPSDKDKLTNMNNFTLNGNIGVSNEILEKKITKSGTFIKNKDEESNCRSLGVPKLPPGTSLYRIGNGKSSVKKIKYKSSSRYCPPPIAPIAPIRVTPSQVANILHRKSSKFRTHLNSLKPDINLLLGGYTCLTQIFEYLNVRDLLRIKQVSRIFNQLASEPTFWKKLRLRGLCILDWEYLGKNIIEAFSATEVDFEGIRCPASVDTCEMWRNFSSIIDYLGSIKCLKFGNVPTFVIEEIVNAAVIENCYNSFSGLESLHVKSLFEEGSFSKTCGLTFIKDLEYLKSLKSLKLDSKHGFTLGDDCRDILFKTLGSLSSLQSLMLPNLKGLEVEQFSFLKKLKQLHELEIGSCESWTSYVVDGGNCAEDVAMIEDKGDLKGAFKYLSGLTELRKLVLCDVIIDESSCQLSLCLNNMKELESLSLNGVTISPDATETLDLLCGTITNDLKQLKDFTITTDDPHTNKCVFDFLKKLDNLHTLKWKVGALVEDSGQCFIPFLKEREESEMEDIDLTCGSNNLEMMDVHSLQQYLQSKLNRTRVDILPQ